MTADNGYANTSRRRHQIRSTKPDTIDPRAMDNVIAVASAGFRLSLVLNAVGTGMTNPDCDIHTIAKNISLFSLMLKQTYEAMRDGNASQAALNAASEISHQGQLVFDEIKSMTDLSQGRDEKGVLRSITIAEKDKWAFKKHKVEYLMGQLEALKLSLAIMLQVLQMGRGVASPRQDQNGHAVRDRKATMQEQAEIQNLIVVQHWSLVELRRLYQLAETEAREEALQPSNDDPPPSYDSHRAIEQNYYSQKANDPDLQLSIIPQPDDNSRAMVKYQERPVQQLDAAFTKALVLENKVLGANVNNIVDHLLHEWTQVFELDGHPVPRDRRPSLSTYYESDEEDTTESEYDESPAKGRMIEAPKRKVKKDVRFRANVESDEDEEYHRPRNHRAPKKHILHSEDDTSSDSDISPIHQQPQPPSRRGSEASNNGRYEPHDRNPRPYASNGRHYHRENPNNIARPTSSRGIPQPPIGPNSARPMQAPNQYQPQGTPPVQMPPNLRPPSYQGPPMGASPRMPPNGGQYIPPGYMGQSPQPPPGNYFPPQPPQQMQRPPYQQRPSKQHRHSSHQQKVEDDKHAANKNLKRGLFGGAAIAGILDLLQGLDGI